MIDSKNQLSSLSKDLLAAARKIMEGKAGSEPKTAREKDLAAHAPPHDKITHADVLVGRGVLKKHPKTGKLVTKEDVEEIEELSNKTMGSYINKAAERIGTKGVTAGLKIAADEKSSSNFKDMGKRHKGIATAVTKLTKENFNTLVTGAVLAKMRANNEEVELDEAMNAADRFHQHHSTAKDLLKSISQHLATHADAAKNAKDYKGKKGPNWGHVGSMENIANQLGSIHDQLARTGEYANEMRESVELDEARTAGVAAGSMADDGHLCATKVFHKEWAEGTPLSTQHADPDADGLIEWYDVMFEHGIERVYTEDMEVLQAESHMHSKKKMKEEAEGLDELSQGTLASYVNKADKERDAASANRNKTAEGARKYFNRKNGIRKALEKTNEEAELEEGEEKGGGYNGKLMKPIKLRGFGPNKEKGNMGSSAARSHLMKKEEAELDEARGRPRKNPMPAGKSEEPEPRQHIIQQLQRAKLSMRGGEHITFKDGTKHHVSGDNAAKVLAKYSGMKPAQKEDFQKKISASHASFKEEV